MTPLKKYLVVIIPALISILTIGAAELYLPSSVYEWAALKVLKTVKGEVRPILNCQTKTLEGLEVFATNVNSGNSFKVGTVAKGPEEMIILKDGQVSFQLKNQQTTLNAGSIVILPPGVGLTMKVTGANPVSYYTFRWKTTIPLPIEKSLSMKEPMIYNWDQLEFKKSAKGGSRAIMRTPTAALKELEMHVTTLNEGEKSHDPHMHPDEEILLVRTGSVEEQIKDKAFQLGPGSLIFLAPNDLHGIRNAGQGSCEYYAIRWITEKTEIAKPAKK